LLDKITFPWPALSPTSKGTSICLFINSVIMTENTHTHVCGRALWGGSGATMSAQAQTSFSLSKEGGNKSQLLGWNKLKS
jgi:hypothetical protein